jgi:hypothetical protein
MNTLELLSQRVTLLILPSMSPLLWGSELPECYSLIIIFQALHLFFEYRVYGCIGNGVLVFLFLFFSGAIASRLLFAIVLVIFGCFPAEYSGFFAEFADCVIVLSMNENSIKNPILTNKEISFF